MNDKSILVIDTPKKCEECQFFDGDCCYATGEKKWEGTSYRAVDNWETREDWCPLKPMPNKRYIKEIGWNCTEYLTESLFERGWNACLEKITGETE